MFEKDCTVEDLIRISIEGPSLEDFDARKSVASWPKIKKAKLQELAIRGACDCNGG